MTGADGETPALELTGVAKSFGPVRANRDASLEVRRGEIHALVGENGAGKSTLMRILSGMYAPDSGRVEVNGRDATGWSTAQAIAAGVGMVHQHFMLVPTLTVAENVVLGREPTRRGVFDRAAAVREVERVSRETGLEVSAERRVAELSVGEAQRVEIVKTLLRGARVLILDEPTAVLSPPEVRDLWRVLRGLRDQGGTVVLITHKLDEVIEVSDAITVMRAGSTVARMVTAGATPAAIARAMVGRDVVLAGSEAAALGAPGAALAQAPAESPAAPATTAARAPSLELRDLVVAGARTARAVDGLSLEVAPGEILGVAGVEGNGQTELVEAIAGLRQSSGGTIRLGGRDLAGLGVRARADAGLSHIPEDRHRRGLVLDYSVADNLIFGRQHHFSRGASLDAERIAAHAAEQVRRFDIRPADPGLPARALSGGNQQKIVIAREMGRDFSVLLAAQPTRGVDVGAIEFIHAQLRAAREAGKAVLLVSAELNELLALADRIAVMYRGRVVAVLPRAAATEERLGAYMTGAEVAA
jgi:simple sugar transport system ATP-binding protein